MPFHECECDCCHDDFLDECPGGADKVFGKIAEQAQRLLDCWDGVVQDPNLYAEREKLRDLLLDLRANPLTIEWP